MEPDDDDDDDEDDDETTPSPVDWSMERGISFNTFVPFVFPIDDTMTPDDEDDGVVSQFDIVVDDVVVVIGTLIGQFSVPLIDDSSGRLVTIDDADPEADDDPPVSKVN